MEFKILLKTQLSMKHIVQNSGRWRGSCFLKGAVYNCDVNYFKPLPPLWTPCMWLIIQTLAWTSNTQRESAFMTRHHRRLLIYYSCFCSLHVLSLSGVTQINRQVEGHQHMLSALNIQAATSAGETLSNLHTREKIGLTDKADVKILPVVTLTVRVMFEHRGHCNSVYWRVVIHKAQQNSGDF